MRKYTKRALARGKGLATIVATAAALAGAPVQAADYPAPGDFQNGAKAWADNCNRCHNVRGPSDLRDDQWTTTLFHMRVRAGLTGQETRDILTFLQESNTRAAPRRASLMKSSMTSGRSGADVYGGTCIACHGADGKGAVPGVPDMTRGGGPLAQSEDVLVRHAMDGFRSPGSTMPMPAKGGNTGLSQAEIRAAVAHMRKTFGP